MELVVVKSLVSGIVVAKVPNENRIFEWKGEGSRVKVSFDDLEKMIYDADARRIFETGLLWIDEKEYRVKLGLEEDDGTSNLEKLIYDKKQIVALLYCDSFKVFKEKVEKLSEGSKEMMIQTAIETPKQLDFDKSDFIRKTFSVDIESIQRARREEAAEKNKEG